MNMPESARAASELESHTGTATTGRGERRDPRWCGCRGDRRRACPPPARPSSPVPARPVPRRPPRGRACRSRSWPAGRLRWPLETRQQPDLGEVALGDRRPRHAALQAPCHHWSWSSSHVDADHLVTTRAMCTGGRAARGRSGRTRSGADCRSRHRRTGRSRTPAPRLGRAHPQDVRRPRQPSGHCTPVGRRPSGSPPARGGSASNGITTLV